MAASIPAAAAIGQRRHGWHRGRLARLAARHPLGTFVLLLALATLLVRLAWGWHTSARLAAAIDDLKARGEPTAVAEIPIQLVAEPENAWAAHMRAFAAIKPGVDSPGASALKFPKYPPFGAKWEALADASERQNGGAFPLARAARRLGRAQLRPLPLSPTHAARVPYREALRLANTLADGATYAHLRGRDAEAVERLRDALHLGRAMRQDPFVVSQLIAYGIDALATDAAQVIAPALVVREADANGAASAAQVRALVRELLDTGEMREGFVRSLKSERAFFLQPSDRQGEGAWALHPLADQTRLRWLADYEALIEAAGRPTYAAAMRSSAGVQGAGPDDPLLGSFRGRNPEVPRYSRWFDEDRLAGFRRARASYFGRVAERRVTAVNLAVRLYRVDHGGRWPDDLASLVPAYLDAVPTNPFLDGEPPLGYEVRRGASTGRERVLLFFDPQPKPLVGATAPPPNEPAYGWQSHVLDMTPYAARQYRDVSRWRPDRNPSGQKPRSGEKAVDGDPDKPDAPRNDAEQDREADHPAEQ